MSFIDYLEKNIFQKIMKNLILKLNVTMRSILLDVIFMW